ncbi:NADH-quinone oxidoreductase subunit N [Leisingera sp. McT4-56]|uniref:NADH-quinone oxidoreductase subunit N n=1 Tax=Leisingera sp. McT4-56 TaxID=2881255 RepID=UPI001CF8E5E9|nr:NADH-quinone oxidoreductase subunit N [Leisingera sp. McT4-56]MCB4455655.1 NADH-quinone oxidoreductase subunit N [Leisingera sp. McT4-56]
MEMTSVTASILASGPEIIIILAACTVLMLSLLPGPGHVRWLAGISVLMIALAAGMSWGLASGSPQTVYSGMFAVDPFSSFLKMVLYLGTALTILMSGGYLATERAVKGEYYALLLCALAGAMIMVSGNDLVIIYVGLELQALSVYVLVGFLKTHGRSNESALKYVILGAFSSGLLLFGLSLFYGLAGTTQLQGLQAALAAQDISSPLLTLAALFLLSGLLFKVGAVPFHMWVPDIYEGAPSPITAFMAAVGKTAAFAVLLRILMLDLVALEAVWHASVVAMAVLTLGLGSLAALVQQNIKRMLAYSSIAHAGFLMLGLIAGGTGGLASVMLYLLIYTFMTLGLFAVIILLNKGADLGEPISAFAGLARSHAGLAAMALVFLFSLAGIPPTGGFFAKFYVLMALIEAGHAALAVIAVLFSATAAWFYLRIIMLMYMQEPAEPAKIRISPAVRLVLLTALAGTLLTGVLPAWFLGLAQAAAAAGLG